MMYLRLPSWPLPTTVADAMCFRCTDFHVLILNLWLQCSLRCWAFFILDRFAALLGVDELKLRLSRAWCANSFFSGIDCVKHAWAFITAASVEMFGISPGVDFAMSV